MMLTVIDQLDDPPPTENYTLSLHDALPIFSQTTPRRSRSARTLQGGNRAPPARSCGCAVHHHPAARDRKSTRLNSSHPSISYAVFCLKQKILIAHRAQHS